MKLWKRNIRFIILFLCYRRIGRIYFNDPIGGPRTFRITNTQFKPRYYSPFYWLFFFILLPFVIWSGGIKSLFEVLDVYRGYTIYGNIFELKKGVPQWRGYLILLRHLYTSMKD